MNPPSEITLKDKRALCFPLLRQRLRPHHTDRLSDSCNHRSLIVRAWPERPRRNPRLNPLEKAIKVIATGAQFKQDRIKRKLFNSRHINPQVN